MPSDLGFYDLRVEETIERQIDLAKSYGVSGFIFHHYWFNGHRLMERPLDQFLNCKKWNFKFCLCWANENFTRRWDGSEHEVLLAQNHTPENDKNYIRDAKKYICDDRYVTIDGKPVIIIYRAALIPNIRETLKSWREIAKAEMGKDLFLLAAQTFNDESDPRIHGFDGAIQFPPHNMGLENITNSITPFVQNYEGSICDYRAIPEKMKDKLCACDYPVIPTVFPSWDNTARRGQKGHVFINSTPDQYADWLAEAFNHAINKPLGGKPIVAINAWNEWAEGAHLEPCQKLGYSYLIRTADTLKLFCKTDVSSRENIINQEKLVKISKTPQKSDTAIIIHAHYMDMLSDIIDKIPSNSINDVIITTNENNKNAILNLVENKYNIRALIVFENRGRDVLPFLKTIKFLKKNGYKYFIKIHTKKSKHRGDGNIWANALINDLVPLMINNKAAEIFETHKDAGMIAPFDHVISGKTFSGSPRNNYWIKKIQEHFKINKKVDEYCFIPGTMFAARTDDFEFLGDDEWLQNMFDAESGQIDGTIAHALERFFGLRCKIDNQKIYWIDPETKVPVEASVIEHYEFAIPKHN